MYVIRAPPRLFWNGFGLGFGFFRFKSCNYRLLWKLLPEAYLWLPRACLHAILWHFLFHTRQHSFHTPHRSINSKWVTTQTRVPPKTLIQLGMERSTRSVRIICETERVRGRILAITAPQDSVLHPGLVSNLFSSLHWILCAIDLVFEVIF